MTTTIIETVTSTTNVITFTAVQERDVAVVGVRLADDGSFLAGVTPPAGWTTPFYTGPEALCWDQLAAGATSHTFTVIHAASMQLLGMLMRSDLPGSTDTINERQGVSFTTVTAGDTVIAYSWMRDMSIAITGVDFDLVHALSHVAAWQHDPLQVPAGTAITVTAASNTPAYALAFRPWSSGPGVEPVGKGGWGVWIID